MSTNIKKILGHPDSQEIINKLLMEIAPNEIHEWLYAKYSDQKHLILSEKAISMFKRDNLEMYSIMREDILKLNYGKSNSSDLQSALSSNPLYNKKLNEYVDKEIDLRATINRMLVACENRLAQLYDQIQTDEENIKIDNTLINWFNLLANLITKCQDLNQAGPDGNINITNNISVQIVDQKIHVILDVIRKILLKLDYDSSMMFMELYNEEMKKIEDSDLSDFKITSPEERMEDAQALVASFQSKV